MCCMYCLYCPSRLVPAVLSCATHLVRHTAASAQHTPSPPAASPPPQINKRGALTGGYLDPSASRLENIKAIRVAEKEVRGPGGRPVCSVYEVCRGSGRAGGEVASQLFG